MKFFSFKLLPCLFCLFCLITLGWIYPAVWSLVWLGRSKLILAIAFVLTVLFACFQKFSFVKLDNRYVILLSFVFIYAVIRVLFRDESLSLVLNILISFCFIFLINGLKLQGLYVLKLFYYFNVIMVCVTILGVFFYYLGLLHPIGPEIKGYADGEYITNYGLFSWKTGVLTERLLIRTGGFYDEPGSLAYIIIFLLAFNRFYIKDFVSEKILLFGGIITFSAAHFITMSLFLMLFYANKKTTLMWIVLVAVGFINLYYYDSSDPVIAEIKYQTFDRFENIINGTDQSRDFNESKKVFDYFFPQGASKEDIVKKYPDAVPETIWFFAAQYGMIGSIILYLPIIYLVFKTVKNGVFSEEMKLLFLFVINLIQRPNFYYPIYLLLIYFTWFNNSYPHLKNESRI